MSRHDLVSASAWESARDPGPGHATHAEQDEIVIAELTAQTKQLKIRVELIKARVDALENSIPESDE